VVLTASPPSSASRIFSRSRARASVISAPNVFSSIQLREISTWIEAAEKLQRCARPESTLNKLASVREAKERRHSSRACHSRSSLGLDSINPSLLILANKAPKASVYSLAGPILNVIAPHPQGTVAERDFS